MLKKILLLILSFSLTITFYAQNKSDMPINKKIQAPEEFVVKQNNLEYTFCHDAVTIVDIESKKVLGKNGLFNQPKIIENLERDIQVEIIRYFSKTSNNDIVLLITNKKRLIFYNLFTKKGNQYFFLTDFKGKKIENLALYEYEGKPLYDQYQFTDEPPGKIASLDLHFKNCVVKFFPDRKITTFLFDKKREFDLQNFLQNNPIIDFEIITKGK